MVYIDGDKYCLQWAALLRRESGFVQRFCANLADYGGSSWPQWVMLWANEHGGRSLSSE